MSRYMGLIMHYRALREDGTIVEGQLDVPGRQEVLRQLERDGLRPIEVTDNTPAVAAPAATWRWRRSGRKVPQGVVEEFMRQLSSLIAAGIPLSRALTILQRQTASPAAKSQWKAIHDAVVDGVPLADAMSRYPQTFPGVHVAMVQAGETGGFLAAVLGQIADFHNRSRELRGRVTSALIYPAVLLTLALLVVVFLLTFFIPRFQSVFEGFGAELPLITRIIVACSETVSRYGLILLGIIVVAVWWSNHWIKTENGKRSWQRLVLRFPIVGPLTARFSMARFCRMLGTLLEAGVPLISALRVACESLGNQTLIDALLGSIEKVKKGSSLAEGLRDCPQVFPETVVEIVGVAEETGRLGPELLRVALSTEAELDRRLRTTVALVEPLMLFGMAAFIGTIFVGMVIPIFALQDYIK
jgi:type II secretory pathway component PulF